MTTPEQFDFDVFLAHNSADKTQVEEIRAKLMQQGIFPWLDKYDLEPFCSTQDQLDNIISQIRVAAVFLGASGIGPWEDEELKLILSKKSIIRKGLVILPDCSDELITKASSFIKERHWVDFRQSSPDPMKQLARAIEGSKYDYFLHELIQILTPIDFSSTIVRAYRHSLPKLSTRKIPNKLEALVLRIAEIPGEKDESKPLWRFVNFLINDRSVDSECQQALKAWAEVQKIPLESTSVTIQDESEVEETYLMIKVEIFTMNKYKVIAALDKKTNSQNSNAEITGKIIDIPIPPDPQHSTYTQEQLPGILFSLAVICSKEYGVNLENLIVQWFLPNELMNLPVEYLQISSGKNEKQCNAKLFKCVIIRSSDRHFEEWYNLYIAKWKECWGRVPTCLGSQSAQVLTSLDLTGKKTIDWRQTNMVGCIFIEHDDCQKQERFWNDLLKQGLPIALWIRQPVVNKINAKKIIRSITRCSFAELPTSLTKHRQKSLEKMSDITSQPDLQVSLLWDDPSHPFPIIQLVS